MKNYTRRSNITQREKNFVNRRSYTGIAEQSSPFSWIKTVEELISPLTKESQTLSTDEKNLFVTYIMGLILRLGHRPQVASNFTIQEYKQGEQYNLFFISNVKSQETGMASFKLKSSIEKNILHYYYTNIRENNNTSHDNFLLTTTNTPITNPVQFIRRNLKKYNIQGMHINSRQYRHVVATNIQEKVDDPETRKRLHQEINQTESTARKYYKLQTRVQTAKNMDQLMNIIEQE